MADMTDNIFLELQKLPLAPALQATRGEASQDQAFESIEPKTLISDFNEAYLEQLRGIAYEIEAADIFDPEDTISILELVMGNLLGSKNPEDIDTKVISKGNMLLGFACYGKTFYSANSYELYYLAIKPSCQRNGLGKTLLAEVEKDIKKKSGKEIVLITSSAFAAACHLYEKSGYNLIDMKENFYAEGEHKMTYRKELN